MKKYKPYDYKNQPDYIQIETTIVCNADCEFCTQKKVTRKPVLMEEKVWKKIIDDTRGLGITYRPFLLNEPFADPRMLDICKYIKQDKTAKLEFNTNASLLTKNITDELLNIGVDIMRFSVDGVFPEKYEQRRKGLNLNIVNENTEYFCKQTKNTNTLTELRMIAFPDTEEEQKLFTDKWNNIAKKVSITDLYSYPWEGQTGSINKPCLKIRKEMFFYVDGRATLCCWDTNERAIIGDVKNHNVLDIWNSTKVKELRTLLDNGEREKINLCSRCDAYKNVNFETI